MISIITSSECIFDVRDVLHLIKRPIHNFCHDKSQYDTIFTWQVFTWYDKTLVISKHDINGVYINSQITTSDSDNCSSLYWSRQRMYRSATCNIGSQICELNNNAVTPKLSLTQLLGVDKNVQINFVYRRCHHNCQKQYIQS